MKPSDSYSMNNKELTLIQFNKIKTIKEFNKMKIEWNKIKAIKTPIYKNQKN